MTVISLGMSRITRRRLPDASRPRRHRWAGHRVGQRAIKQLVAHMQYVGLFEPHHGVAVGMTLVQRISASSSPLK